MVREWLCENMFSGNPADATRAQSIVDFLGDHSATAAHARHIPLSKCEEIGLKIEKLEADKKLQDLVLTVHHSYMHTFSMSPAIKIIENQLGVATVHMSPAQQVFRAIPARAVPQESSMLPQPLTQMPESAISEIHKPAEP
jgi:hypothetical protein